MEPAPELPFDWLLLELRRLPLLLERDRRLDEEEELDESDADEIEALEPRAA